MRRACWKEIATNEVCGECRTESPVISELPELKEEIGQKEIKLRSKLIKLEATTKNPKEYYHPRRRPKISNQENTIQITC